MACVRMTESHDGSQHVWPVTAAAMCLQASSVCSRAAVPAWPPPAHLHQNCCFLKNHWRASLSLPCFCMHILFRENVFFFLLSKIERKKGERERKGVGGRRMPSSGGRRNFQLHSGKKKKAGTHTRTHAHPQAEVCLTLLTWLGLFSTIWGSFVTSGAT